MEATPVDYAAGGAPLPHRHVRIIIFSKDRSFQLSECLHSLHRNVVEPSASSLASSSSSSQSLTVDVKVLFKVSSQQLRDSYAAIERQFRHDRRYEFVEEEEEEEEEEEVAEEGAVGSARCWEQNFGGQLIELVRGAGRGNATTSQCELSDCPPRCGGAGAEERTGAGEREAGQAHAGGGTTGHEGADAAERGGGAETGRLKAAGNSQGAGEDSNGSDSSCEEAFVMMTVDDAFFFREGAWLDHATRLLLQDPTIFSYHLKLHPAVTYSHPADKFINAPPFTAVGDSTACSAGPHSLVFDRQAGTGDWDYPWDLAGSIYRSSSALTMLRCIGSAFPSKGLSHPNHVEACGHKICAHFPKDRRGTDLAACLKIASARAAVDALNTNTKPLQDTSDVQKLRHLRGFEHIAKEKAIDACDVWARPRCACPAIPVMAVVTVNRVQDLYLNNVYAAPSSKGQALEPTSAPKAVPTQLLVLDNLFRQGNSFDEAYYQAAVFPSVHIGDLHTFHPNRKGSDVCNDCRSGIPHGSPLVSVVMPIFNVNVAHLREAWQSVVASGRELRRRHGAEACNHSDAALSVGTGLEKDHGCAFLPLIQIVCVNDGSTDNGATTHGIEELRAEAPCWLEVTVINLPANGGVAAALNKGIAACKGTFVARMDSDDICLPLRFFLQVSFLEQHEAVALVGGQVQVFQSSEAVPCEAGQTITSISDVGGGPFWKRQTTCFPHEHCGIHWRMYFSCCLAHPAVMIRRTALRRICQVSCLQASSDCGSESCSCGPYRETFLSAREVPVSVSVKHVEDYELWLRMLECTLTSCAAELPQTFSNSSPVKRPSFGALANLNSVVVLLRKHGLNVSSTNAEAQQANRASVAATYLTQRLAKPVGSDAARAMLCAESAVSANVAFVALESLAALEDSFTGEYSVGSTAEEQAATFSLSAVRQDARSRTAALAVHVLQNFPHSSLRSKVMSHWVSRYPQDAVEKLRLLAYK